MSKMPSDWLTVIHVGDSKPSNEIPAAEFVARFMPPSFAARHRGCVLGYYATAAEAQTVVDDACEEETSDLS